eukprot:COSAG02_NODE_3873_length_6113_cov_1129.365813_2_plen_1026_part_00
MGCGASRTAMLAERYRLAERDLVEAANPRLKKIREADDEVAKLWSKLDSNGDGMLEIAEIAMILVDIGHPLSTNQIKAVMEKIDTDGSGTIGQSEFVAWYKQSIMNDFKDLPAAVPRGQRELSLHERVLTQIPAFAAAFNDNAPRHKAFCAELARYFTARTFAPKEMFIRKGDVGDEMYLIVSGECDILLSTEPGTQPVDRIGPGDIVGEGALFSDDKRTAFVRADTETVVLVLTRAALNAVLPFYPRVRDEMSAFLEGRSDGIKQSTVEERRLAAQRRARQANKAYGHDVFQEFYEEVQRGLAGGSDPTEAVSFHEVSDGGAGLDVSLDNSGSSPESTPKKSDVNDLLRKVRSNRVPPVPVRSASPLKQALLTQPKLTPRSEALRHDFESGVAELSSQLLDLSVSVSDINAENSRASLNASTASVRDPNAEMVETLEQILLATKDKFQAKADSKLRRVEKSCHRLSDTFKSTYNEELAKQQAVVDVESWLDERGLGRSSEQANCTDEIIGQLQEAQYHPTQWMPLLLALTQEQLMILAEEAAWQIYKRKRRQELETKRKQRERLIRSGLIKACSKVAVHGIGENGGEYRDVETLHEVFGQFGRVDDIQVFQSDNCATSASAGRADCQPWAVVHFRNQNEAKAALDAYKSGAIPTALTLEYDDRMTERMRRMTRPQQNWHRLRVMWRVGMMIQFFISEVAGMAATTRKFEREQLEAKRARKEFEREKLEATEAMQEAEIEKAEALDAQQQATREEEEAKAAHVDLTKTLKEVEAAETSGLSAQTIAQLKRIANQKRKVFEKETREATTARRLAEQERAEAEASIKKLEREEAEMRKAQVKYEKEQREAELVMRIAERARRSRSNGGSVATGIPKVEKFALPAEIAVQQYDLNLKNYRRNALNYASQQPLDVAQQTENVSVRAKVATESQTTANILDGLSRSLLRLDPPKVVMATLRAAEAQLIRSRLEHANDQATGLSKGAQKLQVTKLGAQGSAQMFWKQTMTLAANKMEEDGPHTVARTFVDD